MTTTKVKSSKVKSRKCKRKHRHRKNVSQTHRHLVIVPTFNNERAQDNRELLSDWESAS